MDSPDNTLKEWKEILEKFEFLFRHEYDLLKEGWIIEPEFFDTFFDLVLEACRKMAEKNES